MSSTTDSGGSTDGPTDWAELTSHRQRLLKTIWHVEGPAVVERPDLRDEVEDSDDIETVIDDEDRILKTLNSCGLLNKLVEEDDYLVKLRQGGGNPIIVDYEYDPGRDTHQSVGYGATGKLATMAFDILDREDEPEWRLDDVDMSDPNEVVEALNRIVGHSVVGIVAESSRYRLREEAVPVVEAKTEEAEAGD